MRKNISTLKKSKAVSLDHAVELTELYAQLTRKPRKVMADLMGVEYKTYSRWLLENTLPMNRIAQLEALADCNYISEYLCILGGKRIVIDIPRNKKKITDIAEVQSKAAQAISLLSQWYENGSGVDETIEALTQVLSMLAYQRENVRKAEAPEFDFFGDTDE